MRKYLIICFCISKLVGFSQCKGIEYRLPDKVISKLENYVSNQNESFNYFVKLRNFGKDTIEIYIVKFKKLEFPYYELMERSNRYLLINNERIPILFEYDFRLSETFLGYDFESFKFITYKGMRVVFVGGIGVKSVYQKKLKIIRIDEYD